MPLPRRSLLRRAFAAGGLLACSDTLAAARKSVAPSARLRLAIVGCANRAAENLREVGHEEIVAIADVDSQHLAKGLASFPQAQGFADFREMLSKHGDVDAVVVSTPDHTHAYAALHAMKLGKHCYCEKPLAYSVAEVRAMRKLAAEKRLVTQMGTQIHAGANYRRVVEQIRAGAIGPVTEVQVYLAGGHRVFRKATAGAPPKRLNYDLWLGPTPEVPYVEEQSHFNWRYWWQFGNGALGDFGCHYGDLPFWALDLGAPTSVKATGRKGHDGVNDTPAVMQVEYEFAAAGTNAGAARGGPVKLVWRHGSGKPEAAAGFKGGSGVVFIGANGRLAADYGSRQRFPDAPPIAKVEAIPDSIGHHREWLAAIRTGGPTTCNFGYSGNLTEAVLLGNIAYRAAPGRKLAWNAAALTIDDPAVQKLVAREYRGGWTPG